MREADLVAIEAAWKASDAGALAELGPRVGLALPLDELVKLRHMIRGSLTPLDILRAIDAAFASGIALREVKKEIFNADYGCTKELCLAVRHEGAITVGIQALRNMPLNAGHAWPELRPWFKELPKNRTRLEAWALTTAPDRVRLRLLEAPAQPDTTDERALMRRLVEQPDDKDTLMVLVDHWLEREDIRAEMFRMHAEIEAMPHGHERHEKQKQLWALEQQHGERIAGEIAQIADKFTLRAGFVDGVTLPASTFKKHGARWFAEQPIRHFTPKPWNDAAVDTLERCDLSFVRSLELASAGVGHERVVPIAPLTRCKLTRLESLFLHCTITTGMDGERFFTELSAPRLRELTVGAGFLGAGALCGLAANPKLAAQLERLSMWMLPRALGSTRLESQADVIAHKAFARLQMPNLRHLYLSDCCFESDRAIATLFRNAPKLETVSLTHAERLVVDALAGRKLTELHVTREVDPELAKKLPLPVL